MKTQELMVEIEALPQTARAAIERLVLLLNGRGPLTPKVLPILYPADPSQAGLPFDDPEFFGAWSQRLDITDGAEYIHQVRRGQRQA